MNSLKIIVWTANFRQINGQAFATKAAVDALKKNFFVYVVEYSTGLKGIATYIIKLCNFLYGVVANRPQISYIVPSRSLFGFLRDSPILLLNRILGIKTVAHIHGNDFFILDKIILNKITSALYKNVILISPSKAIDLPDWLRSNKIIYINNFVNDDRLLPLDEIITSDSIKNPAVIDCLYISNLVYSKGILNAILSIKHLNRYSLFSGAIFKFHAFGYFAKDNFASGEKIAKLVSHSTAFDKNFYFGKIRNSEEYLAAIKKVKIFVFPTFYRTELAPLCLIEAMCNGLYIVTSDLPVIRELCKDYPYVHHTSVTPSIIAEKILFISKNFAPVSKSVVNKMREKYSYYNYSSALCEHLILLTK